MIRKYLFFVQNNKIAVLYTHGREISFLSKDGDIFYDIKENFWTWWKDNIDFMDEEARDFVFVWNNKNEVIFNSPYFCEQRINSAWDKDTLMRILSYFRDKNLLNRLLKCNRFSLSTKTVESIKKTKCLLFFKPLSALILVASETYFLP